MITTALRLSRDSGVALVRDGRLEFTSDIPGPHDDPEMAVLARLLSERGYDVDDIDEWVVDEGVDGRDGAGPAPVAGNIELAGKTKSYVGYGHFASHVAAAYSTSPFARHGEESAVLVWDGDDVPRLYRVHGAALIDPVGDLAVEVGAAIPPSRRSLPESAPASAPSRRSLPESAPAGAFGADGVRLLVARIAQAIRARFADAPVNLCFAGGRALQPAWNSGLRAHPAVRALWVPPFADCSGNAIGAAALHLGRRHGRLALDWSARLGPEVARHPHPPAGWTVSPCRPEELARMLHRTGRPAVVLSGRAKVGRRALGARSILAPAVDPGMKVRLNRLRRREPDRPIAALCLAEQAPDVFDPGIPDPFMLYEHAVRPEWMDRIPAIAQRAGEKARLQTVSADDDPTLATILAEYRKWSGSPVLCHTSAGPTSHALFADALSALRWGAVDTVWSDGILFRKGSQGGRRRPDQLTGG
jgi:predicted NodU family carbamoyl transferase